MKILYLHGLDSFLQDDRRQVLERYASVQVPVFDYKNTPNLFRTLQEQYNDVHAIIGSSAGGLVAYYLAQAVQKPCLLFNPALNFRGEMPIPTHFNPSYKEYMRVVIGLQDEIIPAWQSLEIIKQDISEKQRVDIQLINQMKHSYPIHIFENEVHAFFAYLKGE